MKHPSRKPEPPSRLSESVHHQLNGYALAAGAAGVGLLALGQVAEGKIVYTPAHVKIVQNGGLISFDLDRDGIPDFGLSDRYTNSTFGFELLNAKPERQTNEIWQVISQTIVCAGALRAGTKIGPRGNFHHDPSSGLTMAFANFFGMTYGPWLRVRRAYLGLKFVIKGKTHFGWARVELMATGRLSKSATLTGYAYETIPNKPIVAGKTKGPDEIGNSSQLSPVSFNEHSRETANLGLLAQGATSLVAWRMP